MSGSDEPNLDHELVSYFFFFFNNENKCFHHSNVRIVAFVDCRALVILYLERLNASIPTGIVFFLVNLSEVTGRTII